MAHHDTERDFIHKTTVQPWRKQEYLRALDVCRRDAPDMAMADWVRQACDEKAERDLGRALRVPRGSSR